MLYTMCRGMRWRVFAYDNSKITKFQKLSNFLDHKYNLLQNSFLCPATIHLCK